MLKRKSKKIGKKTEQKTRKRFMFEYVCLICLKNVKKTNMIFPLKLSKIKFRFFCF